MSNQHLRLIPNTTIDCSTEPARPDIPAVGRLADLVTDGVRAAAQRSRGAMALHVQSQPGHPADPLVSLDVAYSAKYPDSYDSITLRVRSPRLPKTMATRVLRAALTGYGATRFVGLTARKPSDRSHNAGLDVTVCFPHRLPFIAHNAVSVPYVMLVEQAASYSEILNALGVAHRADHSSFDSRRIQLRSRPSLDQLAETFEAAIGHGLTTALFTAELPLQKTMRVEYRPGRRGHLDVVLGRSSNSERQCTSADIDELQAFLEREFDAKVSESEWQTTTRSWERRPAPPLSRVGDVGS